MDDSVDGNVQLMLIQINIEPKMEYLRVKYQIEPENLMVRWMDAGCRYSGI